MIFRYFPWIRWFFLGIVIVFFIFPKEVTAMDLKLSGKIVFSVQNELCIIHLQDKNTWKSPKKITLPQKTDTAHHPTWLPNGDQVIFEYTQWPDSLGEITKNFAIVDVNNKKLLPCENFFAKLNGNTFFPTWSPNGDLLAYLEKSDIKLIENDTGEIAGKQHINNLCIFEKRSKVVRKIDKVKVGNSSLSWSPDSTKIAFSNYIGEISVFVFGGKLKTFCLGRCPLWHPITGEIYFISQNGQLSKILPRTKVKTIEDSRDWSWRILIGISKDGNKLFFIGGGNFLGSEYSTIDVFDLFSKTSKTLTKKYPNIYGASLFRD